MPRILFLLLVLLLLLLLVLVLVFFLFPRLSSLSFFLFFHIYFFFSSSFYFSSPSVAKKNFLNEIFPGGSRCVWWKNVVFSRLFFPHRSRSLSLSLYNLFLLTTSFCSFFPWKISIFFINFFFYCYFSFLLLRKKKFVS